MSPKQMTIEILSENFEIERSLLENEAMDFRSLGLDSLDVADLIVTLEKKSGKSIPLENFLGVRTVGDVYKIVDKISEIS